MIIFLPSCKAHSLAKGFFWLEWAMLKFNRDLGEELILIGEKKDV